MLFLRSKGNIWCNSRKIKHCAIFHVISLAITVGSIQDQLCMFQKARRRWRKKASYVIETTFSNVYFSPFLHPLSFLGYCLFIEAVRWRRFLCFTFVFPDIVCWFLILVLLTPLITSSDLRIAYRYSNDWYIINCSSFERANHLKVYW